MVKYNMVMLKREDIKRICVCLYEVQASIQQAEFFYPSNEREIYELLLSCDFSLGVEVNNKLIAFSLIKFDACEGIYQFEDTCIIDIYRGNHLQLAMWNYQLRKMQYPISVCTIHPFNYASLITALRLNMYIVDFKICYEKYPRYICEYNENLRNKDIHTIISIEDHKVIRSYLSSGFYIGLFKVIEKTYRLAVYHR